MLGNKNKSQSLQISIPVNLVQTFEFADGITDLADGALIGSEQPAGTNPPLAGVFGTALRLAEKSMCSR